NAVLRRVKEAGDGPERFPDPAEEPVAFLTTWGSHPEWLVRRWLDRWDAAAVRCLVEADNRRPDTFVVPLDSSPDGAAERLR
ncbi:MAG: 16S rRNA (cytosine(967)-C(5))-methyltransferase RsmB, partial [Gemmatimonadetes bacterium]|nr:16S rRNA (cytosine(967)-C(5))-methyltransferase RsmB [Gemmatimonadota bacterium]NIT87931.1 16S rRNA (cytosine(967)-C(5))-methyltransferase RsmB [Gemmatimonadota bacterium]NIU77559.1 16S rRNA (cytosine(967)-C(5))-methyltransferase RsmB [Gammaproteobacteria bacterium]NIY11106.1 16S rRNA (cytosine(967)-C(5))-methyltransferase RsmB [Gemmatimonadota bacterium]NIY39996.1 16S rRNA (cytosine(967)-C(5))-methyltransferase RsmB [Gemmatimonadota bacterium]